MKLKNKILVRLGGERFAKIVNGLRPMAFGAAVGGALTHVAMGGSWVEAIQVIVGSMLSFF